MTFYSIIVAAYNVERTILFTLNSLEAQIFKNFEVIVVNDCSTDNTDQIIQNFIGETKIAKIHYHVNKKNVGLREVRNYGIEHATGDYVLFLDGDDAYHTKSLNCLDERINRCDVLPEILMFSGATFITDLNYGDDSFLSKYYENDKGYERIDLENNLVNGLIWLKEAFENKTYHDASCLMAINVGYLKNKGVRFIPKLIFEDNLFTREVLLNSDNVAVTNEMILLVRKAVGSITRSPLSKAKIISKFYISRHLLNYYKLSGDHFFYEDALSIYLNLLRQIKKSDLYFIFYINRFINYYYFRREKIAKDLIFGNIKNDLKNFLGYSNHL